MSKELVALILAALRGDRLNPEVGIKRRSWGAEMDSQKRHCAGCADVAEPGEIHDSCGGSGKQCVRAWRLGRDAYNHISRYTMIINDIHIWIVLLKIVENSDSFPSTQQPGAPQHRGAGIDRDASSIPVDATYGPMLYQSWDANSSWPLLITLLWNYPGWSCENQFVARTSMPYCHLLLIWCSGFWVDQPRSLAALFIGA